MQELSVTSISLNTHAVMNRDQMAVHSKATSAMNNVKETAARFQKLDNVENVDTDPTDSVVTISPEKPAALPLTPKEQIAEKMKESNAAPRDDINAALHLGMAGRTGANVEVKYGGPDGVIIDVSETGWVGTRGLD